MKTIEVQAYVDYVVGHLRYGHYDGVITMEDDEFEEFKKDPVKWLKNNDDNELDFEIDDYCIDDMGNIDDVSWTEVSLDERG